MAFEFKLPEITFPLVLDTIGKQIAEGYRCHMHCHRCERHASVNLVTVAKHKGMDYPCGREDMRRAIKCAQCGKSDKLDFITQSPETNQVSKWPRES